MDSLNTIFRILQTQSICNKFRYVFSITLNSCDMAFPVIWMASTGLSFMWPFFMWCGLDDEMWPGMIWPCFLMTKRMMVWYKYRLIGNLLIPNRLGYFLNTQFLSKFSVILSPLGFLLWTQNYCNVSLFYKLYCVWISIKWLVYFLTWWMMINTINY